MQSKHRRKPFILVEVLVAASLFVVLLVVMVTIFWRCVKVNQALVKQQIAHERLLIAQTRLQHIFTNTIFNDPSGSFFYLKGSKGSDNQSLVFIFDNNPRVDSDFSGKVLAKLFVESNELCVAIWPHHEPPTGLPKKMQKEVLLNDISSLEIQLFAAPRAKEKKKEKEPSKPIDEGIWLSSWPKDFERAPALIKLSCTQVSDGKPLEFCFLVPNEIKTILYTAR